MKHNKDGTVALEDGDQVRMLTGIAGINWHLRPNAVITLPHRSVTNEEWGNYVNGGMAEAVPLRARGTA